MDLLILTQINVKQMIVVVLPILMELMQHQIDSYVQNIFIQEYHVHIRMDKHVKILIATM